MRKYNLILINEEKNLLNRCEQIIRAIKLINSNRALLSKYKSVTYIELLAITQKYIELKVEETDVDWHKHFDRSLSDKYLVGDCFNPKDETEIFNWILIETIEG